MGNNMTELRHLLDQAFDKSDLALLFFDLGLEIEESPDDQKSALILHLIKSCKKQGRLPDLITLCQQMRPSVAWPTAFAEDEKLPNPFQEEQAAQKSSWKKVRNGLNSLFHINKSVTIQQTFTAKDGSTQTGNEQTVNYYSTPRKWFFASLIIIVMVVIGSTTWLYANSNIPQRDEMTAILRIAVAGFNVSGDQSKKEIGNAIGQELALNIDRVLAASGLEFSKEVWGPDRVGQIKGGTGEQRTLDAQRIAEKHNAMIVIYGEIDTSQQPWQVTPEFYIAGLSFIDALEVAGQHELGKAFFVPGYNDDASRIALSNKLIGRAKPFSQLAIGVAFYATRDFERAYQELIAIENEAIWPDDIGGKQLLYLLLGNVAGRLEQIDLAETWYQQALQEQPGYARAYAGLGNVYFTQALDGIADDEDFSGLDLGLVQQSIDAYQQARDAEFQPDLSDIPAKVHFGLGQAYLIQSYADETVMVAPAIAEFQAVIEAYGDGTNPRLKELAGESYIRLGMIYHAGGEKEYAIGLYEHGVNLIRQLGDQERTDFLEERLRTIKSER